MDMVPLCLSVKLITAAYAVDTVNSFLKSWWNLKKMKIEIVLSSL